MTTLKLDQVSKLYRATTRAGGLTPALRKVSFELRPGEVISLIRESGSGKTTIGTILLRGGGRHAAARSPVTVAPAAPRVRTRPPSSRPGVAELAPGLRRAKLGVRGVWGVVRPRDTRSDPVQSHCTQVA